MGDTFICSFCAGVGEIVKDIGSDGYHEIISEICPWCYGAGHKHFSISLIKNNNKEAIDNAVNAFIGVKNGK